MKLALGTVQFGMPYGIANSSGRISADEVPDLLSLAQQAGIDTLDTAVAYGESESVLGRAGVQGWNVITKLPALPLDCANVEDWLNAEVKSSLSRLGLSKVRGLLLHNPSQLFGERGREMVEALMSAKQSGLTEMIGVSIYDPEELDRLESMIRPDIVQAPMNILDRRMQQSGWLDRLNAEGVEVHARSVFMQGLLLMSPDSRPRKFDQWATLWDLWHRWLNDHKASALETCLGYIHSLAGVTKVVVGIDNRKHLEEIIAATGFRVPDLPPGFHTGDRRLLNPTEWNHL